MMPFRQVIQRVWHAGNDLDRMFGNGMGETVYRLVQRGGERLDRQLLECPNQGVSEAVQAISVRDDAFAFNFVQNPPNLLGRIFMMIQKRNEAADGELEINVVFPQVVLGADQQRL